MQQIIRIDMSTLSVSRETLTAEYAGLGGRGLTSRIISRGSISTRVTCEPMRAKAWASSQPIGPPPSTTRRAGCSCSCHTESEVR